MGRTVPRGQSPGAPGAVYGEVQIQARTLPGFGGLQSFTPPAPQAGRSVGQSPVQVQRIVEGAQLQAGLQGIMVTDLNTVLATPMRVLTPPEFYDTLTNTER